MNANATDIAERRRGSTISGARLSPVRFIEKFCLQSLVSGLKIFTRKPSSVREVEMLNFRSAVV